VLKRLESWLMQTYASMHLGQKYTCNLDNCTTFTKQKNCAPFFN
jgi:hypothetical protein